MSLKPLILGMAAGYHYEDVRPFLVSLEATGFAGDIVLFVSDTTRETDRMQAHGARTVAFERTREMAHVPLNAYRYFLYQDHLRWLEETPERILLTDVRDVIFQSDPFAFPWPDGLNVVMEDPSTTIGTCPHMTRWIINHLGEETWEDLRDAPVSCSGTVMGDLDAVREYLQFMTRALLPFVPDDHMAGYDQGVHNVLLHRGVLPRVTRHDNRGPVLTLAAKPVDPAVNGQGLVLNDAGQPAVMVHQYDRKPDLHRTLRDKYA